MGRSRENPVKVIVKQSISQGTHESINLATEVNKDSNAGSVFFVAVYSKGDEDGDENLIPKSCDGHSHTRGDVPSNCFLQLEAPNEQPGKDSPESDVG